jgi:hypothetical protein
MNDKLKDRKESQDEKHPFPPGDKEHGEGNYKAAREYDEATRQFAKSGKVEGAAKAARPRSSKEAEDIENAEAEGKSRSKGEDSGRGTQGR